MILASDTAENLEAPADTIQPASPATAPPRKPRAPRFATLDAWRGTAALLVVAFHGTALWRRAVENTVTGSWKGFVFLLFDHMWLGVQLFFVISGYCIAAAADSAARHNATTVDFAMRRIRRIYPPYLVSLALLSAALLIVEFSQSATIHRPKAEHLRLSNIGPANIIANITLTQTWLPELFGESEQNITHVGWTLCYEVQFYLLCTVLVAVGRKRLFTTMMLITVGMAIVLAIQVVDGPWRLAQGTVLDGRWLQFACGIGVYWSTNYASRCGSRICMAILLAMAISSACIAAGAIAARGDMPKRFLELSVCAFFALLLIWQKRWDEELLKWNWLRILGFAGVFSYSLYLVHWLFCKTIETVTWNVGIRSMTGTLLITLPLCFAVSVPIAYLFYRLIEKPTIYQPGRATS